MTVAQVAEAAEGELVGDGDAVVTSASIDSRTLEPGALFVAVQGERDGHDFVGDALARGAAGALVERVPPGVDGFTGVRVPGTVEALGRLAARHLAGLRGASSRGGSLDVVGITGSAGKTSTKDLTAAALAPTRGVCASPASFNNELGVPLTVLSSGPDTDVLVLEMGARGAGHIAALCRVAPPQVGVVTNISAAHIEHYDSVEAIAREKGTLLEAAERGVVGTDHDWVDVVVGRTAGPVVTVGLRSGDDVRYGDVRLDDQLRPSFQLHTPWGASAVRLEVRGAHQAANASLAAAAALSLGATLDEVVSGLESARATRWRMQVERSVAGVTVINDAYNANPASTAAALQALASLPVSGRRWAVLGEMAELGASSVGEHRRIGEQVVERGVDRLVVVGSGAAPAAEAARSGGVEVTEVPSAEAAATLVTAGVRGGDAVLVKASRVVGLERVAEALLADGDRDRDPDGDREAAG